MTYKVYLVSYATSLPKAEHHRALFIEIEPETRDHYALGNIYEVRGPGLSKDQRRKFHFTFHSGKAPKRSAYFKSLKEIGHVEESKIERIAEICGGVQPPVVPEHYEGDSPNCDDWVHNVIFRLKEHRVVTFRRDYALPSAEVNMVSKELSARHQASSSTSTQKGSSSKSTETRSAFESPKKRSSEKKSKH